MLTEQRRKIDLLDAQIVALVEERMRVVSEVAKIKKDKQLPVLDSQREALLLTKIKDYVNNQAYEESIVQLYQEMMKISRAFQHDQND